MLKNILLAGCGKMGGALLARWRGKLDVHVVDPTGGNGVLKSLSQLAKDYTPDAVVFAVKPQGLDEVLPEYAERFKIVPLFISIAAGKTLSYYEKHLGKAARVVRAMPNTPAMAGQGMTALVANAAASTADKAAAEALFALAGQTVWLEDEELMHAVTGLSGSGPAYVYLFIESLAEAGVKAGLPAPAAKRLALQTVTGACALAAESGAEMAALRAQVASPGGTTEAALKTLEQEKALRKLVDEAVQAAAKRSKELA